MKQALSQFQTALHSSGKGLSFLVSSIGKADTAKHFGNARFQRRAVQPVEMSLMPEILGSRKLYVDALRLEDYANMAARTVRVAGNVEPHNFCTSANWNH